MLSEVTMAQNWGEGGGTRTFLWHVFGFGICIVLPQQKAQMKVELKAVCKALWGHQLLMSTPSYLVLYLLPLRQQFWTLNILAIWTSDSYSQLAWLPWLPAPHRKHHEHSQHQQKCPPYISWLNHLVRHLLEHPPPCIPTMPCPYYSQFQVETHKKL